MTRFSIILAIFTDLGRAIAVTLGAGKKQRAAALHRAAFPRARIVINSNGAEPIEAGGSRTVGAIWQDHARRAQPIEDRDFYPISIHHLHESHPV